MELAPHITRNLCDKLYDKRKLGALEIERMVKDMNNKNEFDKIEKLTNYVIDTFCSSSNGNHRKGGLIALAGIAIGLGADVNKIVTHLTPPVLKMFIDQDSRVRYYACEAMYNISKVGCDRSRSFYARDISISHRSSHSHSLDAWFTGGALVHPGVLQRDL